MVLSSKPTSGEPTRFHRIGAERRELTRVSSARHSSESCKRSLWVARKTVFLTVPSVVMRIPATVLSGKAMMVL